MKKITIVFLICLMAVTGFAQITNGIVIQGIARNSSHSSIGSKELGFTFEIQEKSGTLVYKETQTINTDAYGVFSHVIGTGTKSGGRNFNQIDYGVSEMQLIVSVSYLGKNIEISKSPFQYVPYAYHAANGVPAGTIIAFAGTEAQVPSGWLLCNGQTVTANTTLKTMMNNTPDLRGIFLRGTGTNTTHNVSGGSKAAGPNLKAIQKDNYRSHSHSVDINTQNDGAHQHGYDDYAHSDSVPDNGDAGTGSGDSNGNKGTYRVTRNGHGSHRHRVLGSTKNTGNVETRPISYGINYLIKL